METVPLAIFYEFCCCSLKNRAVVVMITWKLWSSFPGSPSNAMTVSLRVGFHFLLTSCQTIVTHPHEVHMDHIDCYFLSYLHKRAGFKTIYCFFFFKKFKQWQDVSMLLRGRKSVAFLTVHFRMKASTG